MATFSYLYTNDVRIATLQEKITWVADAFVTDSVPNSSVDKSASNNFATIAYYFGLTKDSNLTKAAAMGNADIVILNFIKKFQFPNPRTSDSLKNELACGEKFAPLREIVKVLVQFYTLGLESYLTLEEIRLFLFYNAAIAKRENYNLIELCHQIVKYRTDGTLPNTITVPNPNDEFWKHETRQVRELTNILKKVKCIVETNGEFHLDAKNLSYQLKGLLFDIVTYDSYWEGESRDTYAKYFDITDEEVNLFDKNLTTTSSPLSEPLQLIYYGAPGTGKSYAIDGKTDDSNSVRTTFHPDSDYASFVGAYKPTMENVPINSIYGESVQYATGKNGHPGTEKKIVYKYVPQAFLKAYVAAWSDLDNPHFLVIEEINRGNCAQIFGDLFQLLDRNSQGASSYAIHADEDIAQFLAGDEKGFAKLSQEQKDAISNFVLVKDNGKTEDIGKAILSGEKLLLPPNLYIWATMNTSDQSLFPIDSAFKRRWNWRYVPIQFFDDSSDLSLKCRSFEVAGTRYSWADFLRKINPIISDLTESADKQMGFFFAKPDKKSSPDLKDNDVISEEIFVNKVLFYLWTDVLKDYNVGREEFRNPDRQGKALEFADFFVPDKNYLSLFISNLGVATLDNKSDNSESETQPNNSEDQLSDQV